MSCIVKMMYLKERVGGEKREFPPRGVDIFDKSKYIDNIINKTEEEICRLLNKFSRKYTCSRQV